MTIADKTKQWILDQYQAVVLVGNEHLRDENVLMIQKWAGYRFMTPVSATVLFAKEYTRAYKDSLRENVDIGVAQDSRVGKGVDFTRPGGRVTQMWIARKRADATGMPYPEYLKFCFDFATKRKRRQLPQPNQLVPSSSSPRGLWNAKLEETWAPDLQLLTFARMTFMPQYQLESGRNLPARSALLEQLIDLRQHHGNLEDFVGSYVLAKGYLDEIDLTRHLDAEVISARISSATGSGTWVRHAGTIDEVGLWQACHGLPGVEAEQAELCEICPARHSCHSLGKSVEQLLMKIKGSHDPVLDRRKTLNRDHVRNHRARKKADSLASAGT